MRNWIFKILGAAQVLEILWRLVHWKTIQENLSAKTQNFGGNNSAYSMQVGLRATSKRNSAVFVVEIRICKSSSERRSELHNVALHTSARANDVSQSSLDKTAQDICSLH